MQVLQLKKRDEEGVERTVGVKVLRSWQDGSGRQLYLHSNGVYGYKDGTPVRTKGELDIIGSSVQREMAKQWWEASGRELSRKFYEEQKQKERERMADFRVPDSGSQTEYDQAMYKRKPVGSKKKEDWSEPFAWMEMFDKRPDWWGQAEKITLQGYQYAKVKVAASEVSGSFREDEV
ncbi:MAG: hypothetical protein ACOCQI_01760 [Desulfosalsimonas sp.]